MEAKEQKFLKPPIKIMKYERNINMPNCCCKKRIISNVIDSGLAGQDCGDTCIVPVYGNPDFLTVLTPVVYDEIGINLCRSIPLPANIPTDFPTAVYATAEVMDII